MYYECAKSALEDFSFWRKICTTVHSLVLIIVFVRSSLKIGESGLKSREMSRLYTKRPPCNGLSKFISVGLNECYFAFYTMGWGVGLAILVLIVEVIWNRRYNGLIHRYDNKDEFNTILFISALQKESRIITEWRKSVTMIVWDDISIEW